MCKGELPTTRPDRLALSDGQLLAQLQAGDLEALGTLYERHQERVQQIALSVTRDPAAAEDVAQECFLRLYRYSHSVDPTRPFGPWLYRVTTNLAYTWMTRKKWQDATDEEIPEAIPCTNEPAPETQVELGELRQELVNALALLSHNQLAVMMLFYVKSLTLQEIADLMGCPVGTIKSRLYYGRENLSRLMKAGHVLNALPPQTWH